jgi:hypothetical protein
MRWRFANREGKSLEAETGDVRERLRNAGQAAIHQFTMVARLDLKLRNTGTETVFVKRVVCSVERVWGLRCIRSTDETYTEISKKYHINLPVKDPPFEVRCALSQEIGPNRVDRFAIDWGSYPEMAEFKGTVEYFDYMRNDHIWLIRVGLDYNNDSHLDLGNFPFLLHDPMNESYRRESVQETVSLIKAHVRGRQLRRSAEVDWLLSSYE